MARCAVVLYLMTWRLENENVRINAMFRINYNNLNKKEVEDRIKTAKAPVGATSLCTRMVGKSIKIVLDKDPVEGPVLEYEFATDSKLTLKENGEAAITCDYGAYTIKDISLVTHMIPGTKKGYNVIINWKTSVVTVFEMWFVDHEGTIVDTSEKLLDMREVRELGVYLNREVQRQYYFGYIEEQGKTPPEHRDRLTLRMENAVVEWTEDREKRRLTTYATSMFSTVVELDTPDGGDVLTFASDILHINDEMFIHCIGEVEYSGRLSVEVVDMSGVKKIGMTMGINENDEFEHTLYKGFGRYCGRYTSFFDFNDKGDKYPDMVSRMLDFTVKGARATYRPSIMTRKVSAQMLDEASKKPVVFSREEDMKNIMVSSNNKEDTDYCAGMKMSFDADDGYTVNLNFKTDKELEYRIGDDTEWTMSQYRAAEIDDDLILLGLYQTGSNPPAILVFVMDFKNGCTTCIEAKIGTKYDLHDVEPIYHFGIINMKGFTPMRIFRHGFSTDLVGHAFTQSWSDAQTSIHMYNSPHSYSWTITNDAGGPGTPAYRAGGFVWSSPCDIIKIRDNVYILNWIEQKWEGLMGYVCRNFKTMRDSGFSFGFFHDGSAVYFEKMGSVSRTAGQVDLSGVYPLTNYSVVG